MFSNKDGNREEKRMKVYMELELWVGGLCVSRILYHRLCVCLFGQLRHIDFECTEGR